MGAKARKKIIAPVSRCRDLVLVDDQPLRHKIWEQYQRAIHKYEKLAADLKQFRDIDTQRYRLWYEAEFSAAIIKLRKDQTVVASLAAWIDRIHTYASLREIPVAVSFEILSEARDADRLEEVWEKIFEKKTVKTKSIDEEDWSRLEDMVHEVFDELQDGFSSDGPTTQGSTPPSKDPDMEKSLRDLFHQLALRLHPDRNPDQGQDERDLFHRVQEAYRARDMETLERIWKRVEGKSVGPFSWETAAVSELIKRKRAVDHRIFELNVELKYARTHSAWNFSKVSSEKKWLSELTRKEREILREKQEKLEQDWWQLNDFISRLESSTRKKKKRK